MYTAATWDRTHDPKIVRQARIKERLIRLGFNSQVGSPTALLIGSRLRRVNVGIHLKGWGVSWVVGWELKVVEEVT